MTSEQCVPALSIRQPWAWAILYARKRLENRSWPSCSYRGPIWIHASLWPSGLRLDSDRVTAATEDALDTAHAMLEMARKSGHQFDGPVSLRDLYQHRGGIVGRARIDGVIRDERDFAAWAANRQDADVQRAWWMGGFALVLGDVEAVEFVPCKGALGLFRVPDDVHARAMAGRRAA